MLEALPYEAVVVADFEFEFGGRDGNRPRPVCMVARELRSGREWRIWRGEFPSRPPFSRGSLDANRSSFLRRHLPPCQRIKRPARRFPAPRTMPMNTIGLDFLVPIVTLPVYLVQWGPLVL